MSKNKNNYNKMYSRTDVKPVDEMVPEEIKTEVDVPVEDPADVEPVKEPAKQATVIGCVKCELLNVRSKANTDSKIVAVLKKDSKVTVELEKSTNEWYKVLTEDNVKGYCMKKFVIVR